MAQYRKQLPQLSGDMFLQDGGAETDLIFNHGIEIREFALHTLLPEPETREAVANYFRGYLDLGKSMGLGVILDSCTWKAHMHWAEDLGSTEGELEQINRDAIDLMCQLRNEFEDNAKPVVLNALIGPRGDAYAPEDEIAAKEAEDYHGMQLGWLAETEIDMVTALTFTSSDEAIGCVRAANRAGLPIVVSFTVETDGKLPTEQPLGAAIKAVDAATSEGAAYFMVNCAHPDHFFDVLDDEIWTRRIRGIRCNASRKSHEELDESEVLDDGDPVELAGQYRELAKRMPWLNVFGACCGADLRHVTQIAKTLA